MVEYEMHLPFIMLSQMYVQIGKISLEASAKDFKRGKNRVKICRVFPRVRFSCRVGASEELIGAPQVRRRGQLRQGNL